MFRSCIPWILASTLVVLPGCTQQPHPSTLSPAAAQASNAACAVLDPPTDQSPDSKEPDPKVQLALVQDLDRRIANAAVPDIPPLLLEIGRARSAFQTGSGTPQAKYAQAHPREFKYNEPGGNWLYQGNDFTELIRRFPNHELADDAAYEFSLLPRGGECEGSVGCEVSWTWEPVSKFLNDYPMSPLADAAVARALVSFRLVDSGKDLRVANESSDPQSVRGLVESLDSVARKLPPPRNARLLRRAGEIWEALAEYDRARSAYQAAKNGAEPAVRACVDSRLALLPAHWFTLDSAIVVHPRRVELKWRPRRSDVNGFTVYRSNQRYDAGVAVARLDRSVVSWTDTGTIPASVYWYRVIADSPDGPLPSNPAMAETPKLRLNPLAMALSMKDQQLHILGTLSNGFPQVLHILPDGSKVERTDAEFIGLENGATRKDFESYIDECGFQTVTDMACSIFMESPETCLPMSFPW